LFRCGKVPLGPGNIPFVGYSVVFSHGICVVVAIEDQGFFGVVRIFTALSATEYRKVVTAEGGGLADDSDLPEFDELDVFRLIVCVVWFAWGKVSCWASA
jgi:hypothetical protein